MKDKKELLEQTIKEDLEKEAQEILKALETSDADNLQRTSGRISRCFACRYGIEKTGRQCRF